MDRMIYTAMNGAKQIMLQQTANNNNLANLNTSGFRADLNSFKSMPVLGPGHQTRIYPLQERASVDLSTGRVTHTGHFLDIAITNNEGFIAIQSPDGREVYTRGGDLRVNSAGMLETGAGYKVLGNSGPIAIPAYEKLEIGADGTISILPLGQGVENLAIIDRVKLVDIDIRDLDKDQNGLLYSKSGEPAAPDASIKLASGSLESSNVNAVDALINMILFARSFEMQVNLMKTAEDIDASSTRVLSLN